MTTMREAFEKWMVNVRKCIVGSSDPYPAGLEQDAWQAWIAGADYAFSCNRLPLKTLPNELPWDDSDFQHGMRFLLDRNMQPHNQTEQFIYQRTKEAVQKTLDFYKDIS